MLGEDKYIDQLFKEKLGGYEKNPPLSLWTNIEAKLDARRRDRRIVVFKMIGVAAGIVLALLAGWQLTNYSIKDTDSQSIAALKPDTNHKADKSTLKITESTKSQDFTSKQNISDNVVPSQKEHLPAPSNISSIAAFAAPTSFINSDINSTFKKTGDLELVSSEREILDELQHKFNVVKKLTDLFSTKNQDSSATKKPDPKTIINPFMPASKDGSTSLATTDLPGKNGGRWHLKAEFASLYNNQAEVKGQNNNFQYNSAPTYKPQKTTPENTISAGIMVGYKVSKRLVVKSGIVYNSVRQTTSDVEFLGVNQYFSLAANSSTASTPTGMVMLNKISNSGTDAMFYAGNQLDNSVKYSPNSSVNSKLTQNLEYIEIPLQATYKLLDKKIAIGVTGEIGTNFLVGNKAILNENGSNISSGETTNMRNVVYSGSLGVELGYEITKRITVTVEPRIKQFINSLSTSKTVNYKPSQLGVVTGLTYSFN